MPPKGVLAEYVNAVLQSRDWENAPPPTFAVYLFGRIASNEAELA